MPRSAPSVSWRTVSGAALLLLLLLSLTLVSAVAQRSDQPRAQAAPRYQLLTNSGMEVYDPPYTHFQGVDCQIATGWERFWYGGPEPYWMDTRVFADSHLGSGWVERIEGETSQLIVATQPYAAGLWQQVSGLTPGVAYGFHAAMLTIYQTSAPPSVDGMMIKQVGIDPAGGTDPRAPTVVWSEPNDLDETMDIDQRTAVYAQDPTITVFVRVISPHESGGLPYLNYSFLDSAILAQTPVVTATSPAVSDVPTFVVNWDNAIPAPGGGRLKWRDVQWMDAVEGVWHDWMTRTYDVEATFVGERGHTYLFRARAWQRYPNGAHLYGPYRPEGDTSTVVAGPRLAGRVLDSEGRPVKGATVAVLGTTYAATSDVAGNYALDVQSWPEPQTVTVSHPWLASPAPVYGVTFGLTETVALTWTLRPPDDAVVNGEFESGLDSWSPINAQGVVVVTEPVHTGHQALALGGAPPLTAERAEQQALTTGVTQTVALTAAWEPALSFWYRPVANDSEGAPSTASAAVFNVILSVTGWTISPTLPVTTTRVYTPDLDIGGWQHQWYYPGRPEAALTGTVTIRFLLRDPAPGDGPVITVYLDEISLGATPGGPHRAYLPLALKRFSSAEP